MNTILLVQTNKPIKNGIFKKKGLEHYSDKYLPKDNKSFHNNKANKIHLSGLKPNKTIFFFGSKKRDYTKKLLDQSIAYGKLENSGVVRSNKNGEATVYLHCPQIYINADGTVHNRHFHYLYWDDDKNEWNKNLYTQYILCNPVK